MLRVLESREKGSTLEIAGNVLLVLDGRVDPKAMEPIDLSHFRFALGSGSFSDALRLGETIVIDGKPHISWVEEKKVFTQSQAHINSPFLMGIDQKQKGSDLFHYKPTSLLPLQQFYEGLAKQYPKGYAILGNALFSTLHSTYIKKSPIYGENIEENVSAYWAEVPTEKEKIVCFFGVVIPRKSTNSFPEEMLKRAFYHNPQESSASTLMSHTHGALLRGDSLSIPQGFHEFFNTLNALPIDSIRHLLTQSVIREGTFALFPIDYITPF